MMKAQELDENRWSPREVRQFINANKDEGLAARQAEGQRATHRRQFIKLYADYEETCRKSGVLDFAELLLRAYELGETTRHCSSITVSASAMCRVHGSPQDMEKTLPPAIFSDAVESAASYGRHPAS